MGWSDTPAAHLHISSMLMDKGWEISPWDSKLTFSPFHSSQQRVTDQHRHEHRTDSPAPGHDWEHLCKQEHHHHSCVSIKSTLWGLKLNSPCRVILSPCHTGGEFGMLVEVTPTSDLPKSHHSFVFFSSPTWTKSSSGYGGQYPPAANYWTPDGPTGSDRAKAWHAAHTVLGRLLCKCNRLQITSYPT